MGMCIFFLPLRILLETIFTIKTRRPYSTFSLSNTNILDIIFSVVVAIRIEREYRVYRVGLDELEVGTNEFYRQYYDNI